MYPEIVSQGYTLAPFEVSLYNTQLVPGGRDRLEEGMVVERITVQEGDGMERYDVYSWFSSEQGTEEIRADVVVITLLAPSADVELDMKELQVSEVKVWSTDFKHCEKSCRYGNCYQGYLMLLSLQVEMRQDVVCVGTETSWAMIAVTMSSLDALDRELEGLQNPSTCTTENTFSWDNTGLSAIVFYLSGLLHISMSYGKAMVVSDKTKFVFGHCPFNNFSCIFEDFSGCSAQSAREADNLHGSLPIHVEEPEDFSSQPVDLFNKLRELRKDFNLTEPFIGWHVRLHVQDELRIGKCPNIEQHVQESTEEFFSPSPFQPPFLSVNGSTAGVETGCKKVQAEEVLDLRPASVAQVFVASDDPEVARQAQLLCPDLEFTSNLAFDRSILSQCSGVTSDCWLEGRVSRGEVHAEDMTRGEGDDSAQLDLTSTPAWLVDVLMLSFSHVIVGQFGSNLSRSRQLPPPSFHSIGALPLPRSQSVCAIQTDWFLYVME
ncbi:hypothetical protein GUITHDRAFT_110620 [Guillardia theta CCMP2712]|uniref:Uncharacterized protein n=1 Tax=Guillardia theta (strain CCMP2712) TaxID=905079 RepID=L1J4Q9_GUITC|nr:hypothetical protein GUITHDRAFT_110620 [Guillardia theta CCMP2712]EKX43496.1 hypothetical protein GUITHDRAFT_110620 [Guillardia theta CCMP2712]|eukprot:XP_005830476.1 hypothetical protein GUITHDRAFT_110620 [Guillardia theta CCMP2712]